MTNWKSELNVVWQAIGNDILGAEGENPDLTGKDLQGIVPDFVETYLNPRLLPEWKAMSYEERKAKMKEAFPDKEHYGY